MIFIKEQIKWNIYQNNVTGTFQNMQSGQSYKITPESMAAIKDKISGFQLADGMHPSERIASSEVLAQGMQLIGSSPILQQAWGAGLPQMFAHLMSLGGVKGIEQYLPEQPQPQTPVTPPGQNVQQGQQPVVPEGAA